MRDWLNILKILRMYETEENNKGEVMSESKCIKCGNDPTKKVYAICKGCKEYETPPADELGELIEMCNKAIGWQESWTDYKSASAVKLLAKRVRDQKNKHDHYAQGLGATSKEIYSLKDRLDKLEKWQNTLNYHEASPDQTNPQARNPLTREEIGIILSLINVYSFKDRVTDQKMKDKLTSYLEEVKPDDDTDHWRGR